jgi:fucose permease
MSGKCNCLPDEESDNSLPDLRHEYIKGHSIEILYQELHDHNNPFFCYSTIETITGLWGSSYLVTVRNIPAEIAARWIALYYIGITSGRFISGFLSMRLNNRQMIRSGHCLIACGITILLLPFWGAAMALPGFFIIGLGCAPIFPALLHETPENFGKEYSQAIMGIQMASAYIGTTLMPPLFGKIASYIGFNIFPIFIGIVLVIKITMTGILNRKINLSFTEQ